MGLQQQGKAFIVVLLVYGISVLWFWFKQKGKPHIFSIGSFLGFLRPLLFTPEFQLLLQVYDGCAFDPTMDLAPWCSTKVILKEKWSLGEKNLFEYWGYFLGCWWCSPNRQGGMGLLWFSLPVWVSLENIFGQKLHILLNFKQPTLRQDCIVYFRYSESTYKDVNLAVELFWSRKLFGANLAVKRRQSDAVGRDWRALQQNCKCLIFLRGIWLQIEIEIQFCVQILKHCCLYLTYIWKLFSGDWSEHPSSDHPSPNSTARHCLWLRWVKLNN